MPNLGIIGVGRMGMKQARAFAAIRGVRVVAGTSPGEASRAAFAADFPHATVYPDHRVLLADPRVDAVVIVTPTHLHARHTIDALRAGKHVLVEKPMARTVAQCRRMNDAARKARRVLMVAHCARFEARTMALARLYRQGRLGDRVLLRKHTASPGPDRAWFMRAEQGGGPMLDGAVHNYDTANMLFGDPQSVVASSIKLTDCTALDAVTAVVRYRNGCQLALSWAWGVGQGGSVVDAVGNRMTLVFGPDGFTSYERGSSDGKPVAVKPHDMLAKQARHFIACIRGKATCITPGTQAIKAVAIAEAILSAAPHGRSKKVKW